MSAASVELRPPEPLTPRHDVSRFSNGVHSSLDQWLHERAHASEGLSARTYVICTADEPARVVGYFSISTAIEQRNALPSAKLRRGMPEQVPLLLIGRLAVDAQWRGRGLGSALLADALRRCLAASEIVGARGGRCPRDRRGRRRLLRGPRAGPFAPRGARHADADRNGSLPGR